MKVMGYSERGVLSALLFEIRYSPQSEALLQGLLERCSFPFLDNKALQVSGAKVFIEQSFSTFGHADALLLIDTGSSKASAFVEAKVKTSGGHWTVREEFQKFVAGIGKEEESGSNLFVQLYRRVRMVEGLHQAGLEALQSGLEFPPSSSRPIRKIGTNRVVLRATQRLADYLDETYYLAILPDDPANLKKDFREVRAWTPPEDYVGWDVSHYGYLSWASVKEFCREKDLADTLGVLEFNEGQIYG